GRGRFDPDLGAPSEYRHPKAGAGMIEFFAMRLQRPQEGGDGLWSCLARDTASARPLVAGTHVEQATCGGGHVLVGDAGNGCVVRGLRLANLIFKRLQEKFGSIGVHRMSFHLVPRTRRLHPRGFFVLLGVYAAITPRASVVYENPRVQT